MLMGITIIMLMVMVMVMVMVMIMIMIMFGFVHNFTGGQYNTLISNVQSSN